MILRVIAKEIRCRKKQVLYPEDVVTPREKVEMAQTCLIISALIFTVAMALFLIRIL
ncbi:MAG: hypothetical protein AB1497_00865 [Bacillota bacterium]